METTIERILALSGNMPNPERHRHYLQQLTTAELTRRLEALKADAERWAKRGHFYYEQPA